LDSIVHFCMYGGLGFFKKGNTFWGNTFWTATVVPFPDFHKPDIRVVRMI